MILISCYIDDKKKYENCSRALKVLRYPERNLVFNCNACVVIVIYVSMRSWIRLSSIFSWILRPLNKWKGVSNELRNPKGLNVDTTNDVVYPQIHLLHWPSKELLKWAVHWCKVLAMYDVRITCSRMTNEYWACNLTSTYIIE